MIMGFKEFLLEMAFSKRRVEEKVSNIAPQMIKHIIKVIRYNDKRNRRKHLIDIHNWYVDLLVISKMKPNPKERDYYKWLYEEYDHAISAMIRALDLRYESLYKIETDDNRIKIKISEIMKMVSKSLHENGEIRFDEFERML